MNFNIFHEKNRLVNEYNSSIMYDVNTLMIGLNLMCISLSNALSVRVTASVAIIFILLSTYINANISNFKLHNGALKDTVYLTLLTSYLAGGTITLILVISKFIRINQLIALYPLMEYGYIILIICIPVQMFTFKVFNHIWPWEIARFIGYVHLIIYVIGLILMVCL